MVESAGGKSKRPGAFVEVLRESQRFRNVDRRSVDKFNKVECICICICILYVYVNLYVYVYVYVYVYIYIYI